MRAAELCYIHRLPPTMSVTPGVAIATCFAPEENCDAFAVDAVDSAEREVLVTAYSLTTGSGILEAPVRAAQRGVSIRLIADRTTPCERRSGLDPLAQAGASVWIDRGVRIAHAKTMVIDGKVTLMGSMNWNSGAARNSEDPQPGLFPRGRRSLRGPLAAAPGRLGAVHRPRGVVPAAHRRNSPVNAAGSLFWRVFDRIEAVAPQHGLENGRFSDGHRHPATAVRGGRTSTCTRRRCGANRSGSRRCAPASCGGRSGRI